jgi:hypothetical protein
MLFIGGVVPLVEDEAIDLKLFTFSKEKKRVISQRYKMRR